MRPWIVICVAILTTAALLPAQATRPAIDRGALEIRANQEFNRAQYASALPMLRALKDMTKDRPDLMGSIEEKIRVCEKSIADTSNQPAPISLNATRVPHPAPKPGETIEINIKDLGNFDFDADKGGDIPADVKALSGTKFRLHGFMIPMDQAANITQFALVADLFSCCFGQPPQLQHTIVCNTPKGKAVSYYPDEITVEGTLKVQEKKEEGFIISIFEVEVSSVKPSPK